MKKDINNDIAMMEIEKFQCTVKDFVGECKNFSEKNVSVLGDVKDQDVINMLDETLGELRGTGYLEVELNMAVPKEILMSLYDIIQQFVQICDTHEIVKKLTNEEKNFYYGIKCINNIIKHQKKNFTITDLITPDFKIEPKKLTVLDNNIVSFPIEDDTFRLGANWNKIRKEIVKKITYKDQINNYKHYIQGRDVIDTTIRMYSIIKKNCMKTS